VEGETRSNTIILDTGTNQETQITENAGNIHQQDVYLVVELLREYVKKGDTVVLAGTLPDSLSPDVYQWLIRESHDLGAEVYLVTSGKPLEMALQAEPDMIIIQKQVLESHFNIPVRDYADVIQCAQRLREEGAAQVLVSFPDEGKSLLLSSEGHNLVAISETSELHSQASTTSGVMEAFVAGFLMGKYQFESLPETLEFGAAAAMYTASQVGSEFGKPAEVEEFLQDVNIEEDEVKPSEQ
jgi:1-phosphofructokinase